MKSLFIRLSASLSIFLLPMVLLTVPFIQLMTIGMENSNFWEISSMLLTLLVVFLVAHALAFFAVSSKQKNMGENPHNKQIPSVFNALIILLPLLSLVCLYSFGWFFEGSLSLFTTLALIHLLFVLPAEIVSEKMKTWKKGWVWLFFISPIIVWVGLSFYYFSYIL